MSDKTRNGWRSRLQERRVVRRERRADRRARRKGRVGGDPDSAVAQAQSHMFDSGGYFTKNTKAKP